MKAISQHGMRVLMLASFGIICASVNLTKAVHIDDTAHIEIARGIISDPIHPMSVEVNWRDTSRPAHYLNQPHLFFYAMALVMVVTGESMLALHAMMALVTMVTIVLFYRLAKLVTPRHATCLTAFLVLGPAFLPGQNVMVDVPLMGIWLLFFLSVLSAPRDRTRAWYLAAGLSAAAGCLVKYNSLVLLPILLFVIVIRRHWRHIWALFIPLAALAGWSLFNYYDYGGIHLLGRDPGSFSSNRVAGSAVDWIAGLGAVAPFSVIFLLGTGSRRANACIVAASILAGLGIFLTAWQRPESLFTTDILWAIFYANGIFCVASVCYTIVIEISRARRARDYLRIERNIIFMLWIAGVVSFTLLFAPFMAVRHILMALPAFLLLFGLNHPRAMSRRLVIPALVATASVGILCAVSDYQYAGVYREYANKIVQHVEPDATVWYSGHWGWQWYAQRAGMRQYDAARTSFKEGDYLVIPWGVDQQCVPLHHRTRLRKVSELTVDAKPFARLRTMSGEPASGYYSFSFARQTPPWSISTAPMETFAIFRATAKPVAAKDKKPL